MADISAYEKILYFVKEKLLFVKDYFEMQDISTQNLI